MLRGKPPNHHLLLTGTSTTTQPLFHSCESHAVKRLEIVLLCFISGVVDIEQRTMSQIRFSFIAVALLALIAATSAKSVCLKPTVSASSYTTQDATVLANIVAFVAEFSLKCNDGTQGISLYAEIEGKTLPVARIGDGKYQVSWTEELKKSRSGDYNINLFDEDGYAALRKALRSGEDISSVKPIATVVLNFPGAYQGPWVNSEFMAAVLAIMVSYAAFTAKSKLLA